METDTKTKPLPIPVHEDLIPFFKAKTLWAEGIDREHNIHTIINVMMVNQQEDGGLLGALFSGINKPRYLVLSATRNTEPCHCGKDGCRSIKGTKVTFCFLYEDILEACSAAKSEFQRVKPPDQDTP